MLEMSKKNMRLGFTTRQSLRQCRTATSRLRLSASGESGAPEAVCAILVHYPLYSYPFAVKIFARRGTVQTVNMYSHGWLGDPTDKSCQADPISNSDISSVGLPSHPWDF